MSVHQEDPDGLYGPDEHGIAWTQDGTAVIFITEEVTAFIGDAKSEEVQALLEEQDRTVRARDFWLDHIQHVVREGRKNWGEP